MINICKDCGHRHRGEAQCKFCDCCWIVLKEKTKKLSWWQRYVNWLFGE
jgi:hypothetical protein